MKNIVFKLLFLQVIFAPSLMGQFCNDGASIIIQSDAFIHIQGDFVNQGGTICNEGLIEVGGDWNNAADAFPLSPGTGEVSFVGTNHTISGNFNTLFNNLTLSSNQQISLERSIGILNTTQLNDGFIELNQNVFHMLSSSNTALQFGDGGILSSNTTDHGFVRWDIGEDAQGVYEIPFFADAQTRIPFTFEAFAQGIGEEGYLLFGTYGTDSTNNPFPNDVSNIVVDGIDSGLNVVDRFWSVDAVNYIEQPTSIIDLSFDAENSADSEVIYFDTTSMTWNGLATNSLSGNSISTIITDTYGYLTVSGSFANQDGDSDGDQMGGGQIGDDQTIVYYSLNECDSYIDERQSNVVYDEFTPVFPSQLNCADVSASIVHRRLPTMNPHSCTPGINGSEAMCVSSSDDCVYQVDSDRAVRFSVTVDPIDDTESYISGISFYEKAPMMFDWIDGPFGANNYPTLYGIRVLKNGEEIYSRIDQDATTEWTLESFSFDGETFRVTERSEFVFELLGYCTVGNGAEVNAWDIDEISILGNCAFETAASISGLVTTSFGEAIRDVNVVNETNLPEYPVSTNTDENGAFMFRSNPIGNDYTLKAFKEDEYINGISLVDLIKIQRHILGIELLDSPYKILAADVNKSGDLNYDDLIELLKLILGVDSELENAKSWMFVSSDDVFDPQNPFNLPTFIENYNLIVDDASNDFIGIKLGDVDGNAIVNSGDSPSIVRSDIALGLQFEDIQLTSGEVYRVDIKSSNFNDVFGFQFTTELDGIELVDVHAAAIDFTSENTGILNSETFTAAYAKSKVVSAGNDEVLFTLELKATQSGMLSDMLKISDSVTKNEAYINNSFDKVSVTLDSNRVKETSGFKVFQNYPNPFNQYTNISFNLEKQGDVELMIYEASGKNIFKTKQFFTAGYHSIIVGESDLKEQSGLLFYRLCTSESSEIRKMTFTK